MAPTQIKRPVSDVGARLISQAAAAAAHNDVDDVSQTATA